MEYDFCDNTTVMSRHGTSYHFSIYDYFSGFSLKTLMERRFIRQESNGDNL